MASFVERLLPLERDYFLWLNHQRSGFLDTFMSIYSDKFTWLPLAVVFLAILVFKVKWKEALLLLLFAVVIGIFCDFISAEFIKPFFGRLRPTHHPDFKDFVDIVQGKRGGRFGFISNHVSNGFGIAMFTSLLFRYRAYTVTIFSWVIVTAYSRIYLGVHFITDVIGGMLWGSLVGFLAYLLYTYCRKKFFDIPENELKISVFPKSSIQILIGTILVIVLVILFNSLFFQIPE